MKKSIIVFTFTSIFLITMNATAADNKPAGYTGSSACQPCHKEIYESWKTSKHAAAFKPKQKDSQACLVCHTTAAGAPDQAATENNIGCEACHGPGAGHVNSKGKKVIMVSVNSADICGRCHNCNQADDSTWTREYTPGMKLSDIKGLKLIPVSPDKLPPSAKGTHPLMIYNMWLASGHAKTPARDIKINGKKWEGPITCVACHNPHNSNNTAQLIMEPKDLCPSCHFQGAVLKGFGAKGIEETRSLHTAIACFSCHMTEKNHLMEVLRPDDPDLAENRTDSCSDCHEVKDRKIRAKQIKDWEAWYNDTMNPIQKDLRMVEEKLKANPDILNAELKGKLDDIRANLSIIINDGSNGVHNLDYALEIMSLAKRQLKEIKKAIQ